MPKKLIKQYLPDPQKIRDSKALSLFGTLLHDVNLWHLNRKSASLGFGIGIFYAFWPVPFQMWFAAATAIPCRANLPISVGTVWITNPFTVSPIFYFSYLVGTWVLGAPEKSFSFELSWTWLITSLETIGPAFLLGCLICGTVFGILGYFCLNALWRLSVKRAWQKRQTSRTSSNQQQD